VIGIGFIHQYMVLMVTYRNIQSDSFSKSNMQDTLLLEKGVPDGHYHVSIMDQWISETKLLVLGVWYAIEVRTNCVVT